MMSELAKAIMTQYNGSLLDAALTGGLYFQQAPEDVSSPWGVFYIISVGFNDMLGATATAHRMVDARVQFSLFSTATDGGAEIADLADRLRKTFDWCDLSIPDYASIKMQNIGFGPIELADGIWQATADYQVWYE